MVISKRTNEQGFTLIELMLAMAFLSAIILFGVLTFVQALAVYNKGISIAQINETGRSLTNDLNRSSNNATSFSVSDQIMCIGKTAYMWNIDSPTNPSPNPYRINGTPIGIVRTVDSIDARNTYCNSPTRTIAANDVTSLIGNQVRVLGVEVTQPDTAIAEGSSLEAPLLRFVLTIGTRSEDGAVEPVIQPGNTYYSCPTGSLGTFCAVGTYSTTIYVQSGS